MTKEAKIALRISDDLEAYLTATAEFFSAALGREVGKSEVLIRLAEEGKARVDAMKSIVSVFDLKNSVTWTTLPRDG